MKLYDYAYANAPVRIRILLYLKGLTFKRVQADLIHKHAARDPNQPQPFFPTMMVPTLSDGDLTIGQSLAIAEYIEELFPDPPILPRDAAGRARTRSLASIIACDGQPLANMRVRQYLTLDLGFSEAQMLQWVQHWLSLSLQEYEEEVAGNPATGKFSHGDQPTLADIFLVPQMLLAERFGLDIEPYPRIAGIYRQCLSVPAFSRARTEYLSESSEMEGWLAG